jgi:hypothetical protein
MKLPLFWVKEEGDASTPAGKSVRFSVWRWSETNLEEARGRAREAIANVRQRIQTGQPFPARYAYVSRPVREEVLRELPGGFGGAAAAITRNAYGALVLNTAKTMFVDSDDAAPTGSGILASLFRRGPQEDPAIARARALAESDADINIRVYKTKAGTRYLLTHALFEPTSEQTRDLMQRLGADPKYVQLCKVQESFRARLTPKPWRCGLRPPTVRWPWPDRASEAAMREWVSHYERACAGKAVCSLVATMGSGQTHPEVSDLVRLHDELAGVGTQNPLA